MPDEKPKRQRKPKEPTALTIPAPTKKPWELTAYEVNLVKNHIAKGATDEELSFCLGVARRYKLDPFRGQIWFVKRRDRKLDKREGNKNVPGYRWIPIVGINGLLHLAARDHKRDFGSNDEPEYGPMIEVEWSSYDEQARQYKPQKPFKGPEWAKVAVYKKGADRPTVGTVWWEEVYPNVDSAPMVRQMPRLMLGKCALAQAMRRAYPATDGLYIQEEFMVEPYEPSENAKLAESAVETIDKRITAFKALSNGELPTEAQMSLLEQGKSPEEVLLEASVEAKPVKPVQVLTEDQVADIGQSLFGPSTARD